MEKKTFKKWGYHPTEPARVFNVEVGGTLPEGWAERPVPMEASETEAPDADASDWEQLFIQADTRAKALEIENASLKEELSALKDQMAAKEPDPDLQIPQRGGEPQAFEGLPKDWRELHHSTRIRMAKALAPDVAELITNAKEADEVLEKLEADLNG